MKTIARFVCRPKEIGSTENPDVILGLFFRNHNSDLIKANHTYELREVLGELIIVDLGESMMDRGHNLTWGHSLNEIIQNKHFILTDEEYESLLHQ